MRLFGTNDAEALAVAEMPLQAEGQEFAGLSAQQQHHATILGVFHAATEDVADGERIVARATEVQESAVRTLAAARGRAGEARRQLRRVAEGHI